MKKKLLLAAFAAAAVMASAGALTACNNTEAHKCGHVCPDCNKCTTDCTDDACKDKCEGHAPATVDMTEGVYSSMLPGTNYTLLVKFYDGENCYFQNEFTGYRAKYKLADGEITYCKTQEDGTDYNSAEHGDKAGWVTGNKIIYFYQEDGTTPIDYTINKSEQDAHDASTVQKGFCYAYGTPTNALAYNEAEDKIQSFGGSQGSRTLTHDKSKSFTANDEKPIEQAKFMPKELPDGAESNKVLSDYHFTLSQKGYSTNIPALEALNVAEGSFTKDGNVYSLTDTINGTKATLTETANGATVQVGTSTVELIKWEKVIVVTGQEILNVKATVNLGISVEFTLSFKDNCTAVMSASMRGNDITVSADWRLAAPKIVFSNESNGKFGYEIDGDGAHVTWTGDLSENAKNITVTFDFASSELAKLQNASPEKATYRFTGTAGSGAITLNAYLYSNGAVKIEGVTQNGPTTVTTGTWERGQGLPTVTLEGSFTATVTATSQTDVKLNLHGNIGMGESDYVLAMVTE